jgi:hypothetical protein
VTTPEEVSAKRAQMDALLVEFRTAQAEQPEDLGLGQTPAPRRLHHYTTLDGLTGIVAGDTLWASDARFLNDSSELTYAADLIDAAVEDVLAGVTSDTVKAALPERRGFANGFEYGRRPFIACFCEEEDLLSQWRGYDAGQTGFSLGLGLSSPFDLPEGTYLRKVVYDPDRQRSSVSQVVRTWVDTAEQLIESGRFDAADVFPYPAIWALQEALAEHHLCFKHPTFAEEREWRLIKLVNVREELRLVSDRRREELMEADTGSHA